VDDLYGAESLPPSRGRVLARDDDGGLLAQHLRHSPSGIVESGGAPSGGLKRTVITFAPVEIGDVDGGLGAAPGRIRLHFEGPKRKTPQKGRSGPIEVPLVVPCQVPAVPAVGQLAGQDVYPGPEVRRKVIGVILHAFLIGSPSGGQFILPDPLPVAVQVIQPKGRHVRTRRVRHFLQRESLPHTPHGLHGLGILRGGRGGPSSEKAPRVHQPGLKGRRIRPGLTPVFIPYADPPEIAGPGQERQARVCDEVTRVGFHCPGIPEAIVKGGIRYLQAVGRLSAAPPLPPQFPGETRLGTVQAHGIHAVFGPQFNRLQQGQPLLFVVIPYYTGKSALFPRQNRNRIERAIGLRPPGMNLRAVFSQTGRRGLSGNEPPRHGRTPTSHTG